MGFIRGPVSQLLSTGCRVQAESFVPHKKPTLNTKTVLFMHFSEQLKSLSINTKFKKYR